MLWETDKENISPSKEPPKLLSSLGKRWGKFICLKVFRSVAYFVKKPVHFESYGGA